MTERLFAVYTNIEGRIGQSNYTPKVEVTHFELLSLNGYCRVYYGSGKTGARGR